MVSQIKRLGLSLCRKNLVNNAVMFLYDGPGAMSPLLYRSDVHKNDFFNSSTYIVQIVLWSLESYNKPDIFTYSKNGSAFLQYCSRDISYQIINHVPNNLEFSNSNCDMENKVSTHCLYLVSVASPLRIQIVPRMFKFSGPVGLDCHYGGVSFHNVRNSITSFATSLCGQSYMDSLPYDLPTNFSILSAESAIFITFAKNTPYSDMNVSLALQLSKCRGVYLNDFLEDKMWTVNRRSHDLMKTIYITMKMNVFRFTRFCL